MTQPPPHQPPAPDEEQRHAGRTVVAALFSGAGIILAILLWRVFGGG